VLSCKHFVAGLSDYLDGALSNTVRAEFDRHAAVCARCRIVFDTTRKTVELYKQFLPCAVTPSLDSRVMAALRDGRWPHHRR